MGFFDSSSSSNTTNKTQNVSGGAQDGALSIVSSGDADYSYTSNVTDGNAIQNMFDVTIKALSNQQALAENALGLNTKALDKSLNFVESVKSPDSQNLKKIGLYFAVATVLIVIAVNLKG